MNKIVFKSIVANFNGYLNDVICLQNRRINAFAIFHGVNPLEFSFTSLLLEMCTVLILSHILRLILKPLKQPRVISDVLVSLLLILLISTLFAR